MYTNGSWNRFGGYNTGYNRFSYSTGTNLCGCREALEALSAEAQRAACMVEFMQEANWNTRSCGCGCMNTTWNR